MKTVKNLLKNTTMMILGLSVAELIIYMMFGMMGNALSIFALLFVMIMFF